jgi:GMP synthase-like glutamine amidotransferase
LTINKSEEGRVAPVFSGIADPMTVLQWHGAEVMSVPLGADVLASSDRCGIQAFRYGEHAYGLQFHVEITGQTVADWAAIPVYASALEAALGPGAAGRLRSDVEARLPAFNRDAKTIYENYKALIGVAAS